MAEYIERKVAIEKTEAFCDVFVTKWTDEKVLAWIKNLPAADVVEVKHGRWERDELFTPYCTVCGESPMSALRPEGNYHYCPNCGARMDGGNE